MSAKTTNQHGRRTPLSLSGGFSKGGQAHNKGGNSAHSSNGHSNSLKQDNKNQQNYKSEPQQQQPQSNAQKHQQQENPTRLQNKQAAGGNTESKIPKPQQQQTAADHAKSQKQGNQNDRKQQQHQQTPDKQQHQNGGQPNNHKSSGGNQQSQQSQQNKDKQQNDKDTKSIEKCNNKLEVTPEKSENNEKDKSKSDEKEMDAAQEKSVKDEQNQKNVALKKDEESKKDEKVEKTDADNKIDENNVADKQSSNVADANVTAVKESEKEKEDKMDIIEETVQQEQQQKDDAAMSAPPTPKSVKDSKPSTPNKPPTPIRSETTPQKSTPTKRQVTTCIDDFEMEPLTVEDFPSKEDYKVKNVPEITPSATSTPGKFLLQKPLSKTDVQLAMQPSVTPERPREFSQISGRRAIRPITEYTPSKFQSNSQFRESYRRINTELDITNTSLNVTVGSEIPNNASFSFFGRGRKRERTPPQQSQSAIGELQSSEMEISPPKRARMDFFSVVSSPLSLLRNRFSKASLQSSTPVKLQHKIAEKEDDIEVQNVSGVSVHEDIEKSAETSYEDDNNASLGVEADADNTHVEDELEILDSSDKDPLALKTAAAKKCVSEDGDIKITETPLQSATDDATAKNKRCTVM